MAVIDICLNDFGGYITNTTKKFTWAPEMPFTKMPAQPRMLAEKFIGASTLQKLKSFRNAQCRWQTYKNMYMVRLNLKLINFNPLASRNFAQKLLAMPANNHKLKRVLSILRLPHQMKRILTNTVPAMFKSFHFSILHATFCGANATLNKVDGRANYAARSFSCSFIRKSLRRYRTPLG